jgi:hypothetical protein
VAGDENEARHRQKLRQADHAEVEGAMRQRIDLPADRYGGDLVGTARKPPSDEKQQERLVAE